MTELDPNELTQAAIREAELLAEIERLRQALEPFARIAGDNPNWPDDEPAYVEVSDGLTAGDFNRAQEALGAYQQKIADDRS